MYGNRTATDAYRRAVIGAFAFTHHRLIREHGKRLVITATDVHDLDMTGTFARVHGRDRNATPIKVDVRVPWGRPDPRGPEKESYHVVFERLPSGRIASKQERYPCETGTIVPLDLTPSELTFHAAIAAHRMTAELERGYALIRSAAPPPDLIRHERPMLTERAGACSDCPFSWGCTRCPRVSVDGARPNDAVVVLDVAPDFDPEHTDFAALPVVPIADEEMVDGEIVGPSWIATGNRLVGSGRTALTYELWRDMHNHLGTAEDLPAHAWANRDSMLVWEDFGHLEHETDDTPKRPPFDYRERAERPYGAIKLRGEDLERHAWDAGWIGPRDANRLRERDTLPGLPRAQDQRNVLT